MDYAVNNIQKWLQEADCMAKSTYAFANDL